MNKENLGKAVIVGAAWITGLRLTYRLLGLVSTAILARLLTPEDFGIVAIAMSFFALIDIFSKSGFQTVLVQMRDPTPDHYNSAWTLNFIFGLVAAGILTSISGLVADFYDRDELRYILWLVACLFVLNGLKNIGVVDFQKELTFDKEFKLIITPKFISFFITIGLALYFLNYWALVLGNVIWKIIEVIATYVMHPFRPTITVKNGAELFKFSKWLLINNLFNFVNKRVPELVLGKLINPQASAIYNLSQEIGTMSTSEVVSNLNRAIYPAYSKISDNITELHKMYIDSIKAIATFVLPLGVGVSLVSPFLVPVFLGEQWLEAIVPLSYISLSAAIGSLRSNGIYLYYAIGKPRIVTFELLFKTLVFIVLLSIFININGVVGATQGLLLANAISLCSSWFILKIVVDLPVKKQLAAYIKPSLATLGMAGGVLTCMRFWPFSGLTGLVVYSGVGTIVYVIVTMVLWMITGKPDGVESRIVGFISDHMRQSTRTGPSD